MLKFIHVTAFRLYPVFLSEDKQEHHRYFDVDFKDDYEHFN